MLAKAEKTRFFGNLDGTSPVKIRQKSRFGHFPPQLSRRETQEIRMLGDQKSGFCSVC